MANIKGLSDFKDNESDSEGGDFNDYYAGGEKSGQLIRGAPDEKNKKKEGKERVTDLFERAKELGAEQGSGDPGAAGPSSSAFGGGGGGRALGSGAPAQAPPRAHVVRFYANNVFTLDDGPARAIDDPANHEFMDAVARGECPPEIDPGPGAEPVTVNLIRVEEDYVPPKYVAFGGEGRALGGGGGGSSGAPAAAAAAAAAAPPGEWEGVDDGKPTTSLQLRLYDGSRLVARFNHTHTIADVRRFIRASRPDMSAPYTLGTAFPPAPVADESATLEAAGLLNSVLIQRKA